MVTWKVKGFFKADAETVYKEITALGDSFSPEQIVEAAREEGTELHKCFTWDDTVAAENWRRHQARVLVAQLVVKTETTDREPVAVRVIASTAKRQIAEKTTAKIKLRFSILFFSISSPMFQVYCSGTGSLPDPPHGLQRKTRLIVSHDPFQKPKRSKAVIP